MLTRGHEHRACGVIRAPSADHQHAGRVGQPEQHRRRITEEQRSGHLRMRGDRLRLGGGRRGGGPGPFVRGRGHLADAAKPPLAGELPGCPVGWAGCTTGCYSSALAEREPFAPIFWGMRLASHLPQRSLVTVTTNVPGPREPLYLRGRRIVEILPYVPIALRMRVGVSILTYCDRVAFGVTADYASAPEADLLACAIEAGIAELVAAA